jgi:hypothetical protein
MPAGINRAGSCGSQGSAIVATQSRSPKVAQAVAASRRAIEPHNKPRWREALRSPQPRRRAARWAAPQFTADPYGAFRRDAEKLDCLPTNPSRRRTRWQRRWRWSSERRERRRRTGRWRWIRRRRTGQRRRIGRRIGWCRISWRWIELRRIGWRRIERRWIRRRRISWGRIRWRQRHWRGQRQWERRGQWRR